jgi:hypothetical protein
LTLPTFFSLAAVKNAARNPSSYGDDWPRRSDNRGVRLPRCNVSRPDRWFFSDLGILETQETQPSASAADAGTYA